MRPTSSDAVREIISSLASTHQRCVVRQGAGAPLRARSLSAMHLSIYSYKDSVREVIIEVSSCKLHTNASPPCATTGFAERPC